MSETNSRGEALCVSKQMELLNGAIVRDKAQIRIYLANCLRVLKGVKS